MFCSWFRKKRQKQSESYLCANSEYLAGQDPCERCTFVKYMKLEMYIVLTMVTAHFGLFFYYVNRLNKESEDKRYSN